MAIFAALIPLVAFQGALALTSLTAGARSGEFWAVGAPLTEEGYQQVAAIRDDEEMKAYVRHLLGVHGLKVLDEAELSGFVPHYSGTVAVQSLLLLAKELRSASWVGPAEEAAKDPVPETVSGAAEQQQTAISMAEAPEPRQLLSEAATRLPYEALQKYEAVLAASVAQLARQPADVPITSIPDAAQQQPEVWVTPAPEPAPEQARAWVSWAPEAGAAEPREAQVTLTPNAFQQQSEGWVTPAPQPAPEQARAWVDFAPAADAAEQLREEVQKSGEDMVTSVAAAAPQSTGASVTSDPDAAPQQPPEEVQKSDEDIVASVAAAAQPSTGASVTSDPDVAPQQPPEVSVTVVRPRRRRQQQQPPEASAATAAEAAQQPSPPEAAQQQVGAAATSPPEAEEPPASAHAGHGHRGHRRNGRSRKALEQADQTDQTDDVFVDQLQPIVLPEFRPLDPRLAERDPAWKETQQNLKINLPDVESIVSNQVNDMLENIAKTSEAARDLAAKKQAMVALTLARRRDVYEGRINRSRAANEAMVEANERIHDMISYLIAHNHHLRDQGRVLRQKSVEMRHVLGMMAPKFALARKFVLTCKEEIIASRTQVNSNLKLAAPVTSLDNFMELVKTKPAHLQFGQLSEKVHHHRHHRRSLLQTTAAHAQNQEALWDDSEPDLSMRGILDNETEMILHSPANLVHRLGTILHGLEEAEKEGAMKMEAYYLATIEDEDAVYARLLGQQSQLNNTVDTLKGVSEHLTASVHHFNKTRADFQARLGGVRVFSMQVANALSTVIEASTDIWKDVEAPMQRPIFEGARALLKPQPFSMR